MNILFYVWVFFLVVVVFIIDTLRQSYKQEEKVFVEGIEREIMEAEIRLNESREAK